jgi:hypothetical protein
LVSKKEMGMALAICIIGIQFLGDLVKLTRGDYIKGVISAVIAGALLIYPCSAPIINLVDQD